MSNNREIAERIARRICIVRDRILESSKPVGKMTLDLIDEEGRTFGSWTEGEIADVIHEYLEMARVEPRAPPADRSGSLEGRLDPT